MAKKVLRAADPGAVASALDRIFGPRKKEFSGPNGSDEARLLAEAQVRRWKGLVELAPASLWAGLGGFVPELERHAKSSTTQNADKSGYVESQLPLLLDDLRASDKETLQHFDAETVAYVTGKLAQLSPSVLPLETRVQVALATLAARQELERGATSRGIAEIANNAKAAIEAIEADRTAAKDALDWPAPGSEDTELGVLMGSEVHHGEAEVYARVQA